MAITPLKADSARDNSATDLWSVGAFEDASSDLCVAETLMYAADGFINDARQWVLLFGGGHDNPNSTAMMADISRATIIIDEARDKVNDAKVQVDIFTSEAFASRRQSVQKPSKAPSEWERALAKYVGLREISNGLSDDSPDVDSAVDEYCEAMDHLIENVPAPHAKAVKIKLELALERASGFVAMMPSHQSAIFTDITRLGSEQG
jgi:hypothetical protein